MVQQSGIVMAMVGLLNAPRGQICVRAENHAAGDIKQLARDQARKKANLAREQTLAEAQEARKLKVKKQPPERTE
jgi:hypothetical protein